MALQRSKIATLVQVPTGRRERNDRYEHSRPAQQGARATVTLERQQLPEHVAGQHGRCDRITADARCRRPPGVPRPRRDQGLQIAPADRELVRQHDECGAG